MNLMTAPATDLPGFTQARLKKWALKLLNENNSLGGSLLEYANAWGRDIAPAGPGEQPSEAPAIAEWRKSRAETIAATNAYNVAHRAALESEEAQGFGFASLTKEFATMTEASNKMHRLIRPALDALYATPAIAVAAVDGREAASVYYSTARAADAASR
jgi:hypothetical protein